MLGVHDKLKAKLAPKPKLTPQLTCTANTAQEQSKEMSSEGAFHTGYTALSTSRTTRTRRLAQAQNDPKMNKIARLAQVFKEIYNTVIALKGIKHHTFMFYQENSSSL